MQALLLILVIEVKGGELRRRGKESGQLQLAMHCGNQWVREVLSKRQSDVRREALKILERWKTLIGFICC